MQTIRIQKVSFGGDGKKVGTRKTGKKKTKRGEDGVYRSSSNCVNHSTEHTTIVDFCSRIVEPIAKILTTPVEKESQIVFSEDEISGTYSDDLNIRKIHGDIVERIRSISDKRIEKYRRERQTEEYKKGCSQSVVERRTTLDRIKELDLYIEDAENSLENYIRDVSEIIKLYEGLGPIIRNISFANDHNEGTEGESPRTRDFRDRIISGFLEIARRYVSIDIRKIEDEKKGPICIECKISLKNESVENGIIYCPQCNGEYYTVTGPRNIHSDILEQCINSVGSGGEKSNLWIALVKQQGKQNNNLPSDIFWKLDTYARSIGKPIGEEIKREPLNPDGTRGDTSRELLRKMLKEIKMNSYYDDAALIGKIYWGWILPDYTDLEEIIMYLREQTQPIIDDLVNVYNGSAVNTQYQLYRYLEHLGCDIYLDHFKIPATEGILEYNDMIWTLLCEKMNWDPPRPIHR